MKRQILDQLDAIIIYKFSFKYYFVYFQIQRYIIRTSVDFYTYVFSVEVYFFLQSSSMLFGKQFMSIYHKQSTFHLLVFTLIGHLQRIKKIAMFCKMIIPIICKYLFMPCFCDRSSCWKYS